MSFLNSLGSQTGLVFRLAIQVRQEFPAFRKTSYVSDACMPQLIRFSALDQSEGYRIIGSPHTRLEAVRIEEEKERTT